MSNWKIKLMRFMQGRRGPDEFTRFLSMVSLAVMLLSFIPKLKGIFIVALVIMIYTYFRMMSKNIGKRYNENQWYIEKRYKFLNWFNKKKRYLKESKTYKFYNCEKCGQTMRVPKGQGKITITCPKCKNIFKKKT